MNDEEFGRLSRVLIRGNSKIETEGVINALWEIWQMYGDEETGDWKE